MFIFLKITPKHQRSDAGYLGLPQRSCKTLIPPLSEKVNVLNFKRKEKKSNTVVAKIYSKNEPSIPEIVKKEKEIFSFALAPQSAKVTATLGDKCSVKMEKSLNSYNKIFCVYERSHSHSFYYSCCCLVTKFYPTLLELHGL